MTALAQKRGVRRVVFNSKEMKAAAEQTYQGGAACIDRSTGLVRKATPSVNLVPVGLFAEDRLVVGGGTVVVNLLREVEALWLANDSGTPVTAAMIGGLCYMLDDQTVSGSSAGSTRSVAGTVWDVDAIRGVLVELRRPDSRLGGLAA